MECFIVFGVYDIIIEFDIYQLNALDCTDYQTLCALHPEVLFPGSLRPLVNMHVYIVNLLKLFIYISFYNILCRFSLWNSAYNIVYLYFFETPFLIQPLKL